MNDIRVRFAPSPTGYLHVGGARTALFNWLFARHHGGSFILRIEDTDVERSTEESARQIIQSLTWLGIDWDEGPLKGGDYGPYFQSERLSLYREYSQKLLDEGKAYLCFCTQEELAREREEARKQGRPPRYSGRCRDLSLEERERCLEEGRRPVIRLMVPRQGTTVVSDLIRGEVSFENKVFDDFIIVKSDGMPTYNFACVVDDSTMKISHVIRAEEHLSNTPKQMMLYRALGFSLPKFAHVPMILAPDRSKLSKRHGATSVEEFREQGYLPEVIVNYLALLGWSPGDNREIMGIDEIITEFSLDRVSKTAAVYDTKKLTWLNAHYIRETAVDDLIKTALPFLEKEGILREPVPDSTYQKLRDAVEAVQDRVKTVAEIPHAVSYFFSDDFEYEEKGVNKHFKKEGVADLLRAARERLAEVEPFDLETTEKAYRALIAERGIKGGQLIHPTRVALTGRTFGPGLFDVMVILGKERTLERLDRAIKMIEKL